LVVEQKAAGKFRDDKNGEISSGWWFGTFLILFSHHIGNLIIPFDSYFSEG